MKYPNDVKEYVDFLDEYKENPKLKFFNILHMYPSTLAYPNGYYDSRWFILVGYNDKKMEKVNLGKHDGISFEKEVQIDIARIFADGSTLLRFKNQIELWIDAQNVMFK